VLTTIFAKPIIDIGVIIASFDKAKQRAVALKEIGYIFKEENRTDRLFFTKGPENKRTHYLHVGEAGSGYIENMVIFRDYLKKHKDIAKEYEILKKKLADLYSEDRYTYTSKKEKFILSVIKKAKNNF